MQIEALVSGIPEARNSRRVPGWATALLLAGLWLLGLAGGTARAATATPAWQPVGPPGATVFSITRDPGNADRLYAGTFFGGLYRSNDGGVNWTHLASDFSGASVFGIAVDPGNPNRLYAATFQHGIERSLDGGATWSPVNAGFTPATAQDVAVNPNNATVLLAASATGVFRSSDGGTSWQAVGGALAGVAVRNILFVAGVPDLVFAGTSGVGVFRSQDGGLTWQAFNDGLVSQNVTALSFDAAADTLYASTTTGAFRRARSAASWTDISLNLRGAKFNYLLPGASFVLAASDIGTWRLTNGRTVWTQWSTAKSQLLSRHPTLGRIHLASIAGSFLYTDNDGATFGSAETGIQNRFVGAVETLDYNGMPLVYAGSDIGIEAAAERFREDPAPPWFARFRTPDAIFALTAHPTVPGRMFAGTERTGVLRSDSWGLYWEPSSRGITPARILSMDQAPTLANPVYAGTSSGVFISYDDGQHWVTRNVSDSAPQVTAVGADPERPGHAYSGTNDGRIFRTINFGDSFEPTWQEPDHQPIVAVKASRFFNIYAITAQGRLYTSDDIGLNFFQRAPEITAPILCIAVDPVRPWIAYVGTSLGGVYKSETNAITWAHKSTGIDIPVIFSVAIDPANTSTVYAGSKGAVYRSADAGETWQKLSGALPDSFVSALEINRNNGKLIASVDDHGIYQSTDGGASWQLALAGDARMPLVVSKVNADALLAGTRGTGVKRSADSGQTWVQSNDGMGMFVRSVAIDPRTPDTMYATSIGAGVFKSTDGGSNWQPSGIADGNLFNVTVDRQAASTVYVATTEGLARSADGGANWAYVAFRAPYIFDTFADPRSPKSIYAVAAEAKVYRSDDAGLTWLQLPLNGMPKDNLLTGAVHPVTGDLYVGSENFGVFRLRPGETQWEALGPKGLPAETKVTDIEIPGAGQAIYLATTGGGYFGSLDAGKNWIPMNKGISGITGAGLRADPFGGSRLLAGMYNVDAAAPGLYRSTDGGINWAPAGNYNGIDARAVAYSPGVSGLVFAGGANGLRRSTDGGVTWTNVAPVTGAVVSIVFDRVATSTVYVANANSQLFVSRDGGASWASLAFPDTNPIAAMTAGDAAGALHVATLGNGVLSSTDGGQHWSLGAAHGLWNVPVLAFAQSPLDPKVLYVATGGQGVLKSIDGGINWELANNGLGTLFLLTLAIDDRNPSTLYAGTAGSGVYVSEDAGASWRPLNEGLFNLTVTSLEIQGVDHTVIYAGTEGGGLFKLVR